MRPSWREPGCGARAKPLRGRGARSVQDLRERIADRLSLMHALGTVDHRGLFRDQRTRRAEGLDPLAILRSAAQVFSGPIGSGSGISPE